MPRSSSSRPTASVRKASPPPARKGIPVAVVETALWDSYGVVAKAAERLGILRESLTKRIAKSPRLQAARDAGRERLVDAAETGLAISVEKREAWAITLALKTLGKSRGYVERQELDALFALVEKDPADMTDEELEQALARATSRRRG